MRAGVTWECACVDSGVQCGETRIASPCILFFMEPDSNSVFACREAPGLHRTAIQEREWKLVGGGQKSVKL